MRGVQEGDGTLLFGDGHAFTGQFLSGQLHGQGKLVLHLDHDADQSVYEGTFCNGVVVGVGTLYCPGGGWYIGEFANGAVSGNGSLYLSEDTKWYEGAWQEGLPHGEGTMSVEYQGEQCSYVGTFVGGQAHGSGRLENSSTGKIIYDGLWTLNKPMQKNVLEDSSFVLKPPGVVELPSIPYVNRPKGVAAAVLNPKVSGCGGQFRRASVSSASNVPFSTGLHCEDGLSRLDMMNTAVNAGAATTTSGANVSSNATSKNVNSVSLDRRKNSKDKNSTSTTAGGSSDPQGQVGAIF